MLGLRQNRHYPNAQFLALVAEEGCKVVIGSDAHKPERVGCFEEGLQRLLDAGVDPQRVVNLKRK